MPDTIKPLRQDTRAVTVTIFKPGTDIPIMKGVWDMKTGGQIDSEERLYHPGAMEQPISLGGRRNIENLTLSRLCRVGRDWNMLPTLAAAVGRADVTVQEQPLDFDGMTQGNPFTYRGTLKRVQPPEYNSEGTDEARIEIEVTVEGTPG